MSWFDTPLPSTIKPPTLPGNEWEDSAIDPSWINEAEQDFWFRGGAGALEALTGFAEGAAADVMQAPHALKEGIKTGGLYLSAEGAALRWLMLQSVDTSGPKAVTPEQAKEEFGIDIDSTISMREAYARKLLKDDYEAQLKTWMSTALQFEKPLTSVATWVGTGAALFAMPSTRAFKHLIQKSVVAGGTAIANAAMMQAAAKLGGNLNQLSKGQKLLAHMHKPVNMFDKWARRLSPTARDVATITAVEGSANALEAIAAHQIESQLGNKYDASLELALGYAAPAVLGAAARIFRGLDKTADTVSEYDTFSKAINKKLFKKADGQEAWATELGKVKRQRRAPKETVVKEDTALTRYQPENLIEGGDDGALILYQPEYRITDRRLLSAGEGRFLEAADDAVEAVMDAPPTAPLLLESQAFQKMLDMADETPAIKKVKKKRKGRPKAVFTARDKKIIKKAYEKVPGLQAELDGVESLALLQKLYGERALNAMHDLSAAWKKMDIDADMLEVFPWLRNTDGIAERILEVGVRAEPEDLFQLTAKQTDELLKRAQPKPPEAKILKEPQAVTREADPVKAVQEAADEAAAAERVKLTTDSPLQETEKFITFKDPKTGKMLKFAKDKIKKVEGHAAGRQRADAVAQPTGGLEAGPVQRAEFADDRAKGRGNMVLVRHKDGTGEAFSLPESFVNRLDKYEKEFPDFPKLERVDKVPFQEGLADANKAMDSAFKEFKKCVGKGGK